MKTFSFANKKLQKCSSYQTPYGLYIFPYFRVGTTEAVNNDRPKKCFPNFWTPGRKYYLYQS